MQIDSSILVLMFVMLSLLLGAMVKSLPKILTSPYSVVLLLIGLALGLYNRSFHITENIPTLQDALTQLATIDPHLILLLFLPTLIFESAFAMETHLFKRMFSQIAILAIPGLILTTCLTAIVAFYFFPWQWSWTVCFLFGALISATDPVAVVSLLKEVSSRKRLETLIEGESLLNDGTAIVLFTLFYGMLSLGSSSTFSFTNISISFFEVVLLGLFIGLLVGAIILLWIGRLFNQPMIEITLTISGAYLAYFIAENLLHVSGVVAVVALALLLASIGRTRISPEVADFLHHFWQMMAHVANTLIFILVGIIIASRIRLDVLEWWITLGGLYIAIQFIRAISVFTFMPLLKRIGIGINRAKALVLIWGGLRGAVSLALALIIAQDTMLDKELGDQILFLTAGIVVLTIVINSSSMTLLLKILGLDKLPAAKQASLDKAQLSIKQRLLITLPALKENEFLQRANWPKLDKEFVSINEQNNSDPQSSKVVTEQEQAIAFKRRLLEIERQFYWTQFKQGALTGAATKQLVSAVENALDGAPQISPRDSLFEFWKTPPYLKLFNRISYLNRIVVHLSFERLALSYDTARGFVQAQQEIQKHLQALSPSPQETERVAEEINYNQSQTRAHIKQLRDNFPDLSYSLETHSAHRLMLNLERVYLTELIDDGVLDHSEAEKLTHEIEYKLAHLQQQPHHVSISEINKQITAMPWAKDLKKSSLMSLAKLAKRQIYNDSELIFRQNSNANAIAVVMHGQVELISVTQEQLIESGSLLGVYAFLSGRFQSSAKALTPVELIWFDIRKLQKIVAKDKHLGELFAQKIEQETEHK
ncbi:MAG: cyclic nucleotide-binding domain-containing protein [Psychromonas sp.]|nr:cyclic nucleotide-binding domain-containing protein [Alteromonadales bacterium]MCP5077522.1 cyclic nucleotide-binding domain-containing protein [Psychromonas sp.]